MNSQHPELSIPGRAGADAASSGEPAPLRLKLKDYFHSDCEDAYNFAWAASRLHFGMRLENMADDEGNMCIEATIYDQVPTVACVDVSDWWPAPKGWPSTAPEPLVGDNLWDELWDAMGDDRWGQDHARAFMLRVEHRDGCCAVSRTWNEVTRQEWFVEFSGLELTGDLDYGSFPHEELASSA